MSDFCRHCGDVVPDWANVCPFCGSTTAKPRQAAGVHHDARVLPGYIVHLESSLQIRRANFTVLTEDGPGAILECPRCGWQFPVNVYTGENITLDSSTRTLRETCPLCGTIQE
jgi:RNA polymerase subunit RPABC4/transcription elongation factor Spt4